MPNEGYIIFNRKTRPVRTKPLMADQYLLEKCRARPEQAKMDAAKLIPRDQKARIGVDLLTRDLIHDEHMKGNSFPNEDKIRAEVTQIAETVENKRG